MTKRQSKTEYTWYCTNHEQGGIKDGSHCSDCFREWCDNFYFMPGIKLTEIE